MYNFNSLCKTAENGSLSSVQSSGSDSSADRIHCDLGSDRSTSPQWKRKGMSKLVFIVCTLQKELARACSYMHAMYSPCNHLKSSTFR